MPSLPRYTFLLAPLFIFISSCQMIWTPKSPKGYVIPRPHKMILDKKMAEISGIFYLQDEKAMIAIADDKKNIYRLTTDGKVSNYFAEQFSSQADYEDVIKVDSTIYVLISDGSLIAINNSDSGMVSQTIPFFTKETNDFETVYKDKSTESLVVVCKKCTDDKGKKRSAYRFDLKTRQFIQQPYYSIEVKQINDVLKDGRTNFQPSAAAWNPVDKRLYMLASAGNLLVVTDGRDSVYNVYRLNPTLYPQAEGIAFATNGDMYISNEAKLGKPTLLRITYKPSRK